MVNTLIALVLSLLVQVQSPNVPLAQKVQALQLAQQILTLVEQQPAPIVQASASTTPDASTVPVAQDAPVLAPVAPPVAIISASAVPQLLVPICNLEARVAPSNGPNYIVYFGWNMDPSATGFLPGYGPLPAYTSHVAHPPIVTEVQKGATATYTLTETMTNPLYQQTTTCQANADASSS